MGCSACLIGHLIVGGSAVIITRKNLFDGLGGMCFVFARRFDIDDGVHGGGQEQETCNAAGIRQLAAAFQKDGGAEGLGEAYESGRRSKMQSSVPRHDDLRMSHWFFRHRETSSVHFSLA